MAYPQDPDGDPIQSPNGGQTIGITTVLRDDSNGPGQSARDLSTGQTAPPGPCA